MAGATVMIIDDQPDFREFLSEYLEDRGFDVIQAGDGVEALRRVMFRKPDVILLDVVMPKMNGYEVCQALRLNPETANVPVLFLTARTGVRDRLAGIVSGGNRYLCKPLDLDELEHMILRLLHRESGEIARGEGREVVFEPADRDML